MLIIGHRGVPGYEPENTLRSFERAIQLKADMVECDVHRIRGDKAVIIHDFYVDRTTNGKGKVSDFELTDIRQLDAGMGERLPLPEEVIELVDRRVPINFELKNPGSAELVAQTIAPYLHGKWQLDDFHVSSFDHHELLHFMELLPGISTGALIGGVPVDYAAFAQKMGVTVVQPDSYQTIDKFVEDAHKRGLKLYAWGSERLDIPSMLALYKAKVDGVFTDHADVTRQALEHIRSTV